MLWVLHSCRDEYLVAVDEPPPTRGRQVRGSTWLRSDLRRGMGGLVESPTWAEPVDIYLAQHEGERNIAEVGRQAGHSAEESVGTYVHVFDEFEPGKRITAEDAIRTARARGNSQGLDSGTRLRSSRQAARDPESPPPWTGRTRLQHQERRSRAAAARSLSRAKVVRPSPDEPTTESRHCESICRA